MTLRFRLWAAASDAVVTDPCPDCARPLAISEHLRGDDRPRPEDDLLCWRRFNDDTCYGERVDWRARALERDRALDACATRIAELIAERDRLAMIIDSNTGSPEPKGGEGQ